ncbi:hypothetical protein KSP40_PGU007301 [Platanthera guangdongensis]|uniref:Uncharacterized protein n=1 Tax=Platanthera guangdongensis TaxID=2320717 RepID=A0ABR2MNA2_9ASPA
MISDELSFVPRIYPQVFPVKFAEYHSTNSRQLQQTCPHYPQPSNHCQPSVCRPVAAVQERFGRVPPVVRTAVPVDGRFEHIVLSCNATSDHAIIWIERESQWALDLMLEREQAMEIPSSQRMERKDLLAKELSEEHKAALRRAVTLSVPDAYYPPSPYGTFDSNSSPGSEDLSTSSSKTRQRMSWDEFVDKNFDKDEPAQAVIRRTASVG